MCFIHFYILKNKAAQLQRALANWMLDNHLNNDYEEYYVPNLVKESVVEGAGQLPKFRDTMFSDQESDLWLIPTAEVPITNIYANEILFFCGIKPDKKGFLLNRIECKQFFTEFNGM